MEGNDIRKLFASPPTTIRDAIQQLDTTGLRILFVVDSAERLVGTLTDGDIRRGLISGIAMTAAIEHVMQKKFVSLSFDCRDRRNEARKLVLQHGIDQIPVLDEEGRIVEVYFGLDFLADGERSVAIAPQRISNPVVIFAGGKGTRLDPFTKILPKPLIPIGDKPIIETIIDRYNGCGFDNFYLLLNYKKEMIKAYFSDKKYHYALSFLEESDYCGTAGGLYLLKNIVHESFIVTNCDTIIEGNCLDFLEWHRKNGNIMTVIGSHKEYTVPYGVLKMNNSVLEEIEEKPRIDLFVNTGTYVFEPAIFEYISDGQRLDMDKLIGVVQASRAGRIGVYPHWGGWFDIGQWDDYRQSIKELSRV